MKRLFLFAATAVLFLNCNTGTDKPGKKDEDDTAKTTHTNKPVKPEAEKKPEVKEILPDTKPEDMTRQDKTGWPEDRQAEVKKNCMQDLTDMPQKEATAFCSCQLNNLMKIFDSYQEAIALYNKSQDQLTPDDMKKVQMVMDTEDTCWEQNMPKDEEENDKEQINPEESRRKKGNN